jgi:hypothetical protein
MYDVEIHNFQSIDHVHVRIEGFTALVGRSNIGKSAIVRAIKSALTGASEDNFVRHGPACEREIKGTKSCKCYCSVHIKADDFDLLWEKGGDRNEYNFNGQKYTAVGKGTPSFLGDSFGLVKIGEDRRLLQVSDQFRSEGGGPIFLLDEPGSIVADVLSDVAQLDRINVASRMAEKDRRDSVAQRKVREKDVLELKIKIAGYDGLDEVLGHVREVEIGERRIAEQTRRRDQLGRLKESIITVGRQFKVLRDISSVVVPDWGPVRSQHETSLSIADYVAATTVRQAVITRLEGVDTIVTPPIEPVTTQWVGSTSLYSWIIKLRTYKSLFARWKVVEGIPTPAIEGVKETSKRAIALASLFSKQGTLEQQIGRLEGLVTSIEVEYQAVKAEEADLGVCPTCTQPVGLDHDHAAE